MQIVRKLQKAARYPSMFVGQTDERSTLGHASYWTMNARKTSRGPRMPHLAGDLRIVCVGICLVSSAAHGERSTQIIYAKTSLVRQSSFTLRMGTSGACMHALALSAAG